MCKRALAGREKILGAEYTDTLDTVNNLGNVFYKQGKLSKAEKVYESALTGYEKAFGAGHEPALNVQHNLGVVLDRQGKFSRARKAWQRALAGCQKTLGSNHSSTLQLVNRLSRLYRKQHYRGLRMANIFESKSSFPLRLQYSSSSLVISALRLCIDWVKVQARIFGDLGHMLLLAGDNDRAVIAFEQQMHGYSQAGVLCDGCDTLVSSSTKRYVCSACEDLDLCSGCYQNYRLKGHLGNGSSTCQSHEFLVVPRDIWYSLPSGVMSADGTTVEDWMKGLLSSLTGQAIDTKRSV